MYRSNQRIPLVNLPALDTSQFNKYGLFSNKEKSYWTISNNNNSSVQIVVELPRIRVVYGSCDYFVYLEHTTCNYGGYRWWFLCPVRTEGVVCGRRVRKLYMFNSMFGCRHCHNLCYPEQNENHRSVPNRIYRVVAYENRASHTLSKMKRRTYNGIPTKNMKKYCKYMRLRNDYLEEGIKLLEGLRDVL